MTPSSLAFATAIIPLAAALSLIAVTSANAADASGVVKTVNMAQHRVTLDSGKAYIAEGNMNLAQYKPGEKVTIQYTPAEGTFWLSLGVAGDATSIKADG